MTKEKLIKIYCSYTIIRKIKGKEELKKKYEGKQIYRSTDKGTSRGKETLKQTDIRILNVDPDTWRTPNHHNT